MALIAESNSGRKDGSYTRIFGIEELGALISRVHSTSIRSGNELERIIQSRANRVDDFMSFIGKPDYEIGSYLVTKEVIKASKFKAKQEPDLLVFVIEKSRRHCYIIELKDGDNFDTKKSDGEYRLLQDFQNHISNKLSFTTSIHFCSFNQLDKAKIVNGFKRVISIDKAMTGKELCDLLGLSYDEILNERISQQQENVRFFLEELLKIDKVKEVVKLILIQE